MEVSELHLAAVAEEKGCAWGIHTSFHWELTHFCHNKPWFITAAEYSQYMLRLFCILILVLKSPEPSI